MHQINYVKLMLAVAGGVVLGHLVLWFASFLMALSIFSALTSGLSFTTHEPPSSAVTSGAKYQHQRHVERLENAKAGRAATPKAKQLWRQCEEWSKNYKATPTETVRLQGKFYCDRYDRYIETGVVGAQSARVFETR